MELRPLDFGGILKRAIVLYGRNFGRFAALAAAAVVPAAIVNYFLILREQPQLDATIDILLHPNHLRTEHVPSLFDSPATVAVVIGAGLLTYYLLAFAFGAIAASVERLHNGEGVDVRYAYEAVLQRWTSVVVIVGCAILALVTAYVAAIVLGIVPIVAAAAFSRPAFMTIVMCVTAAIAILIVFALLCILVTGSCAVCAVVIERYPAAWAIRLFGRFLASCSGSSS